MRRIKLAVYDFDGTLVPFETPAKISLFILTVKPWLIFVMPVLLAMFLFYKLKFLNEVDVKNFVLKLVSEKDIALFWKKHKSLVFPWVEEKFAADKKNGFRVLIISASPETFIKSAAVQLGADYFIATPVKNGRISGANCKGKTKILYLQKFAEKNNFSYEIVSMYSDSKNDLPLMKLAKDSFWVDKKGIVSRFN